MELSLKTASDSELALLEKRVSQILEKRGLKVDHPELLKHARRAGGRVDAATGQVRFPRQLQAELLANMQKRFTLAGQSGAHDMKVPHPEGLFYTGTTAGCMYITLPDGSRREILRSDLDEMYGLVDSLEHVNYYSTVTFQSDEVPAAATDINCLYHALGNTGKFGWIQPVGGLNAKYILEMASVVAGGKKALAKRPIVSPFACVTEPFHITHLDGDIVLHNAEYGVPVFCCAMPTGGANAPITPAGSALVAISEAMGLILMVQCVKPGLPCIAVVQQLMLDMKSTYALQSSMELNLGRVLNAQYFTQCHGIPAMSFGAGSDYFMPGPQAAADSMSTAMASALAGYTFLQDAGQLECCLSYSPLQLILNNEICGMVKAFKKGIDIDDETMAFEDVLGMGDNPNFLAMPHTFRHFREIHRTGLFNTDSRLSWEASGKPDLYDKALAIHEQFKNQFTPRRLPEDVDAELQSIVAHANIAL